MISNKLTLSEIKDISSIVVDEISDHDRDEMAIPSYLHANPLIRWLMWKRYEVIASMLPVSSTQAAMEFGCGMGLFLPEMKSRYDTVYAMDLFPQYALELTRRYSIDVNFIDSFSEIPDNSLDVIIAADVLEHLDTLEYTLGNFQLKLKNNDNASLIVSGPTENIFYKIGRYAAGFGNKGDYHHTNINALISDIVEFGFQLKEESTLPLPFGPCLFRVCRFVHG